MGSYQGSCRHRAHSFLGTRRRVAGQGHGGISCSQWVAVVADQQDQLCVGWGVGGSGWGACQAITKRMDTGNNECDLCMQYLRLSARASVESSRQVARVMCSHLYIYLHAQMVLGVLYATVHATYTAGCFWGCMPLFLFACPLYGSPGVSRRAQRMCEGYQ